MAAPSSRRYQVNSEGFPIVGEPLTSDLPNHHSLSKYIQPILNKLADLHGIGLDHHLLSVWRQVTEESFALPSTLYSYCHSTINGDGIPLQLSVSLGHSGGGGLRLLTESGPLHHSIADRIEASTRILGQLGRQLGLGASDEVVNAALPHLFPEREETLAQWSGGAIWIALGCKGYECSMKYYINMDWGSEKERWIRAGKTMVATGLPRSILDRWISLYETWGRVTNLEGFMLDPGDVGLRKIKIYFRTRELEQAQLAKLFHDMDDQFDYELFVAVSQIIVGKDRVWPDHSLVFSYEIDVRTLNTGFKVDMNCREIGVSDNEFVRRIGKVCQLLRMDSSEYLETYRILTEQTPVDLLEHSTHHRFIGLGHFPGAGVRLNVYMEPLNPRQLISTPATVSISENTRMLQIKKSWRRAANYILSMSASDGKWSDFQMPVGMSDEWVTAYVTAALAEDQAMHPHLSHAMQWLQERFRHHGGWGYNRTVPSDADSTSWALIALQKMGLSEGFDGYQLLTPYQRADGLFTTYVEDITEGESWGIGHFDVTAVALQALLSLGKINDGSVERCMNALLASQREDGGWDSFWWKDDLYTSAMAANALSKYAASATVAIANQTEARQALKRLRSYLKSVLLPDESFAIALWLQAWILAEGARKDADAEQFWRHLLARQQPYGGWESAPILRLSHNSQERPWEHDHRDRMYRDHNGLFTTATVINTLSAYRAAYHDDDEEGAG